MLKKTLLLSSTFMMVAAAPAMAQIEDEIIVTATKRAQTLQEVPVAVTVTTSDVIEKAQILDIKDLQSVVPTFRVSQLQNSANTSLSIRGFGNGGNNIGIEPAVGVFIDGVYRSRAAASIGDLPKLERVEVLSGPQSTLFGKNASAGVVSVVTAKPDFETNGYVEAGVGNFNQIYSRAYLTGGISDTMAVSLGGGFQNRDGYFTNLAEANDFNDLNRYNLRGQILWQPTDNAEFRLIADRSELNENCCGTGVIIDGPFAAGQPNVGDIIRSLGANQPSADNQFSYETFANRNSLVFLENVFQEVDIRTFTQELRLDTSFGDKVDVLLGAYYFNEDIDQDAGIDYGRDTRTYIDQAFGLAPTPANIGLIASGGAGPEAQAAFGAFNAGVTQFATAVVSNPATNPLAPLFGLQFQPQQLVFPNSVEDGRTNDDKLTYTARLAYEVNDNFNVYGSYATGFKSSSWNLTRDTRPFLRDAAALQAAGLLPNNYNPATGRNFGTRFAEPEEAEVFEIGLKARFDWGAFNIAAFDQTIENFQSTIFQGTGFVLSNAGSQSTKGIEFDSTFDPFESLRVTFAGVLLDPVYDDFQGAPGPNGTVVDLSGEKPAGISEVSLSTSATYTQDLGNGMEGFIRGDYQYESDVQIVDNIAGVNRSTNILNGSVGVSFDNGVSLQVWGRNLNNDQSYTSAFPGVVQGATINGYPSQPRTYGASARYTF